MPATTSFSNSMATPAKRFELPALEFKFGSLTEGTDIPPPLPSPVHEAAPKTPLKGTSEATNGVAKPTGEQTAATPQSTTTTPTTTTSNGVKQSIDAAPVSPTGSNRPGSVRRLFSRNMMNAAYNDGEAASHTTVESRPASRSNLSVADDKRSRRSSGWFRRLRSPESTSDKRASRVLEEVEKPEVRQPEVRKPAGPPPPMIPDLSSWSKVDLHDEGSLGNDLFSNIK